MHHVAGVERQGVRNEIILHSGVGLNDVSTLSAHVDIEDLGVLGDGWDIRCVQSIIGNHWLCWTLLDGKLVAPILEGSSVLIRVDRQRHELFISFASAIGAVVVLVLVAGANIDVLFRTFSIQAS